MAKKRVRNQRLVIAVLLFLFGLSLASLGQIGRGSILSAEIIVVPYFGSLAEQQPDPWVVTLETFARYGNPLYYWEQITD